MMCVKCGLPLRIIGGGNKSEVGTDKIVTVHVMGCMNPDCDMQMVEQSRQEVENESFID
jgi:hypothetical protein